jgi:hypothetical protein
VTSEWQVKSWECNGLKWGAEGRVRAGVLDHIRELQSQDLAAAVKAVSTEGSLCVLKETFSNRRSASGTDG